MKNQDFYISTGDKTAMYTLRVMYDSIDSQGYPCRADDYLCNLSNNWEKALAKAKVVVENEGGTFDASEFDLNEIRRRNSEIVQAEREAKEAAQREAAEVRDRERIKNARGYLQNGEFPFGKYQGWKFSSAPKSYIRFLIETFGDDDDVVIVELLAKLREAVPSCFVILPEANGLHVQGWSVKDKVEFTGTVIAAFSFEGFYGWTDVTKIVLDSGELVVHKGTRSFEVEVGDVIKMKASVKAFDEYEGEKQTLILRPKLLELNGEV